MIMRNSTSVNIKLISKNSTFKNLTSNSTFNQLTFNQLTFNQLIKALSLGLVLLLTSCAKINNVTTNLDSKNFTDYFAASHVGVYTDETEFESADYQYMGLVEGQDCQEKAHHAVPDPVIARTEARRQAYGLGGNAVIFSSCVTLEQESIKNSSCLSTLVCYGSAFKINSEK